MTKVIKWYQRISFWTKIKFLLAPISIGGAVTVYTTDSNKGLYLLPLVAYAIVHIVDTMFKDEDGDGKIDQL